MNTVASATPESSTPSHPNDLISEATRVRIGARRPIFGAASIQYAINRPPHITDDGQRMVKVSRQNDGSHSVSLGRQGMCADIYTEARLTDVAAAELDATVLRVCTARSLTEVLA